MFIASRSEVIGEEPGLQSVATAIGTPWARKAAIGGSLRFAQGVERARQHHRDRPRRRHRGRVGVVRVFEMIGGQRAERAASARAAQVRELLGMKLDRQPEFPRPPEDPRDLRGVEGDAFAEAVHRVGQPSAWAASSAGRQTSSR